MVLQLHEESLLLPHLPENKASIIPDHHTHSLFRTPRVKAGGHYSACAHPTAPSQAQLRLCLQLVGAAPQSVLCLILLCIIFLKPKGLDRIR